MQNKKNNDRQFVPNKLLETAIKAVGEAKPKETTIINHRSDHKTGKTALAINIIANIIWGNDSKYFNYPNYIEWPFLDFEKKPIKRIRIVSNRANLWNGDTIYDEILKWWPKGRYKEYKRNKSWHSLYESDTGWIIDVMAYDQNKYDFEGPLIAFHFVDEPVNSDLVNTLISKHVYGGILLFTQNTRDVLRNMKNINDIKT